jgi:hypothetical protein
MQPTPPEVLQKELDHAETEQEITVALRRAYDAIDQLHDQYVGLNWIHLDCRKELLLVLLPSRRRQGARNLHFGPPHQNQI